MLWVCPSRLTCGTPDRSREPASATSATTLVTMSSVDSRTPRRCVVLATVYIALAVAAALCSGAAVALTLGTSKFLLAVMSVIYAMVAALLATERAAALLAGARVVARNDIALD